MLPSITGINPRPHLQCTRSERNFFEKERGGVIEVRNALGAVVFAANGHDLLVDQGDAVAGAGVFHVGRLVPAFVPHVKAEHGLLRLLFSLGHVLGVVTSCPRREEGTDCVNYSLTA